MEKTLTLCAVVALACSCGETSGFQHDDFWRPLDPRPATLSGGVSDACTGAGISARVSVSGKTTCSRDAKPYFELRELTAGGPQAVGIGKEGYRGYSTTVTLEPGFNVLPEVQLTPIGGCGVPPETSACTCELPECQ